MTSPSVENIYNLLSEPLQSQRLVSSLPRTERLKLLDIVLNGCFPSDIESMQNVLKKYGKTSIDFISCLPEQIGLRILLELPLIDCLRSSMVCRAWRKLFLDNEETIWRHYVHKITQHDPIPPRPPEQQDAKGWKELYRAIYFRESNWELGLAQKICVFRGHTSFVTCVKQYGDTLITGSYDETIRIWNVASETLLRTIKVQGSISCLDCSVPSKLICAGCHDVGRVLLIDLKTGKTLHALSGHNKGIKAITMNEKYVVSAGMDKALVVWDWHNASKIVRFGQQTVPPIGVSFIDTNRFISVQTDGIIRTFDINQRKLVGQFTPHDLLKDHAPMKSWLRSLNSNSTNVFMWLYANQEFLSLGTRDFLLYFQWSMFGREDMDISLPPKLISYIKTNASTNDLVTGVSDPAKRRVITATRFAARTGAPSRRIYIGHFTRNIDKVFVNQVHTNGNGNGNISKDENESDKSDDIVMAQAELVSIQGAWAEKVSTSNQTSPTSSPSKVSTSSLRKSSVSTSTSISTSTSASSKADKPVAKTMNTTVTQVSSSPSSSSTSSPSRKTSLPLSHSKSSSTTPRRSSVGSNRLYVGTPTSSSPDKTSSSLLQNTPSPTRRKSSMSSTSSAAPTAPTTPLSRSTTPLVPTSSSNSRSPRLSTGMGSVRSASRASTIGEPSGNERNDTSLDLASPSMNPMAMVCDHEKLVVGTTGGIVYSVSFVGTRFRDTEPNCSSVLDNSPSMSPTPN